MSSVSRPPRGPSTGRPRARRGYVPEPIPLEDRRLLSSLAVANEPTDAEQYMLELVNRARANPAAEGQRLLSLARTDPVLQVAVHGWDLDQFVQTISAYGPQPPLALNTRLVEAARDQGAAMLAANLQFHSAKGYLTSSRVARADDGQAYYPTGPGAWATGENVFAYSRNVGGLDSARYVDYFHAAFLIDWGNPDYGHLRNLLAPGPGGGSTGPPHAPFTEIGIGLLTNVSPTVAPAAGNAVAGNQGLNVGPAIVTQEFGYRSGISFLTGCFYSDRDADGFYSLGEGLGGVTVRAVGRDGRGVYETRTWSSGGYALQLPPGVYDVSATGDLPAPLRTTVSVGKDNVGWGLGFPSTPADRAVPGDYDGDGRDDLAVFRASTGQWFIDGQPGPVVLGTSPDDVPVPGDYDGDGRDEPAIYQPGTGNWYALGSTGARYLGWFGNPNLDIPAPGDYDGLGRAELAVYRPTTGQFFILGPAGWRAVAIGQPGVDVPMPADYDGDGRDDPAVYRPSTGDWYAAGPGGARYLGWFGDPNLDIPAPGDHDGLGRAELAVYRPTTGQFFILGPAGWRAVLVGQVGLDLPLVGDFDGDGRDDPAVYRPSTAAWLARLARGGVVARHFGRGGDALPAADWLEQYRLQPLPGAIRPLAAARPQAETDGRAPVRRARLEPAVRRGSGARPNALLRWARPGAHSMSNT